MDDGRLTRTEHAMARCHLWVRGRVQGVGFRVFAEQHAQQRDLSGWARNLPDGRLEVVAEGLPQALEQFVSDVRRGPSGARVEDVQVAWESPADLRGFRIS
jgi:acylphosphatase